MGFRGLFAVACAFSLALRATAAGEGNSVGRRTEARLDMWVEPVLPFDIRSPTVRIVYSYVGSGAPIALELPSREQIRYFREIGVAAEGHRVYFLGEEPVRGTVPEGPNVIYEGRTRLAAGQSARIEVPLRDLLALPDDWGTLEVTPVQLHRLGGLIGTLIVRRQEARAEDDPGRVTGKRQQHDGGESHAARMVEPFPVTVRSETTVTGESGRASEPGEQPIDTRRIDRARSGELATAAALGEADTSTSSGGSVWIYLVTGLVAGVAVGAAGASLLLRRRGGG
jgi:hypothetical protein